MNAPTGAETLDLELIEHLPDMPTQQPAVLFVHGSCVGAWIWAETFLPYFKAHGFPAYALSLTGHGGSPGRERLNYLRLSDYTEDTDAAIRRIGQPLVLVGHSMGGAVVQNVIRTGGQALGIVLMASVPAHGLGLASTMMMLRDPELWQQLAIFNSLWAGSIDRDVLRRGLLSDRIDAAEFETRMAQTHFESPLVGMELATFPNFAAFPWQMPPTLILGGGDDRFLPVSEIQATASYYGTEAVILEEMSHTMMVDPDWQIAADTVIDWIGKL